MTVGQLVALLLKQDQNLEVRRATECCYAEIDGVDLQFCWGKKEEPEYLVIE